MERLEFIIEASSRLAGLILTADPSLAVRSLLAYVTSETALMHYIILSPAASIVL